ncbi:MAG: 16S rRNA (uracil(1498)-N(3))-methyltransferase [Chlamydiae bacterium]|nr:16S rRNA (uracil(1498)-N(3))-methyltransferase [Chlamydiota bacterium]MBI3267031.1 16S rRNA (uracil(1498)-N(3))-methyltransferase [Chlamydiota bacterium]
MSTLPRIYIEKNLEVGDVFELDTQVSHHLIHVLRMKEGEEILFFTPQSSEYLARFEKVSRNIISAKVLEKKDTPQKTWKMVLAQAIPKSQRMDWLVEKATELGVDEIFPLLTNRVVKKTFCKDRWERIAISASEQCGRVKIPKIHEPQSWASFLETVYDADLRLIASLGGTPRYDFHEIFKSYPDAKKVIIAIGPEGDFSPQEIQGALDREWKCVSLGSLVLRVETAALASLAVLNFYLSR